MENIILVLFAVSLVLTATANRIATFLQIIIGQGILLFAVSALRLQAVEPLSFLLIISETLLIKAIVVPVVLSRVVKKTKVYQEADPTLSHFYTLLGITLIIVLSFVLSYSLKDQHLNSHYFTVSIAAIFVGILLMITRHRLITHIIGYVILENGVYLLSLAVGNEMPLAVAAAMLLDLFTGVLIFGLFLNRIANVYKGMESKELTELRD